MRDKLFLDECIIYNVYGINEIYNKKKLFESYSKSDIIGFYEHAYNSELIVNTNKMFNKWIKRKFQQIVYDRECKTLPIPYGISMDKFQILVKSVS